MSFLFGTLIQQAFFFIISNPRGKQAFLKRNIFKREAGAKLPPLYLPLSFIMAKIKNKNSHHPGNKRQRADPFLNITNEEKNQ